eukprot:CAMPEP_0170262832 /NCGR_PEP_ID=MMETSP0116_2-20130129/31299_1 /TAXON_ID=400756 /ORGANISM="Durinskia baltica, Strain CSIRO CS-38" /LENGTH=91 /DNA_ID=CAMNT_0010513901 /DNA_START=235 /DNA_END=508 /DNA_ORIENTATION=-
MESIQLAGGHWRAPLRVHHGLIDARREVANEALRNTTFWDKCLERRLSLSLPTVAQATLASSPSAIPAPFGAVRCEGTEQAMSGNMDKKEK